MTILNDDKIVLSSAIDSDCVSSDIPGALQDGLIKEAGQTGIFIYATADYTLYLKNASGNWVSHAVISGTRETITVPWGDNTAAYFLCDVGGAKFTIYRKTGNILYDSTPSNASDDQNTLLTGAGSAAQAAQNYTFPEADGAANQVLATDGAGSISWADQSGGSSSGSVVVTDSDLTLTSSNSAGVVFYKQLSADATVTLPSPAANFSVKIVSIHNQPTAYSLTITSANATDYMIGLVSRSSLGGTADGWDNSPASYTSVSTAAMPGTPSTGQANRTMTMVNLVAGSVINLHSDGTYWYVTGVAVSAGAGASESSITFS
tara:strand:+ start:1034 stop:1990 length:957 start_codon:yes stop_codon:yes gene_type:complete